MEAKIEAKKLAKPDREEAYTAKIDENVSSRSLLTDEAAVQFYTDSLQRVANRFECKSGLWKCSLDSTYLQDVYNSLWYSLNLLDVKGYYLEVKNYTTAIYIREIDSLLNGQLAELETLYSDSLTIEMLGKVYVPGWKRNVRIYVLR